MEQKFDNQSPFFAITKKYRFLILSIYLLSLFDCFFLALKEGSLPLWMFFLSKFLTTFLLLLPVIFYSKNFGWFHPLIFPTAIGALRTIGIYLINFIFQDSFSAFVFENDALPSISKENFAWLVIKEQLLLSLGLAFYYLSFFGLNILPAPRLQTRQIRFLTIKALLIIAISSGLFFLYLGSIGGLSEHLLSWQGGRKANLEGIGFFAFWIYLAPAACLIWFCLEKRALFNPFFILSSLASLAMVFLVGGSRSSLLNLFVIGLLIWIYREKKLSKILIVLSLVLVFFITGMLGNVRLQLQKNGSLELDGILNFGNSLLLTQQELQMRANLRKAVYPILAFVPKEVDYLYGQSYLAAFTVWIPRSFWPNKPGLIDGLVGETFYDAEIGIPPGPIGEAYWNFGYLGVPLVFFIFGIFHRWLYRLLSINPHQPVVFLLYITILFNVYPVTSSIISSFMLFVPILIVIFLLGVIKFPAILKT